MSPSVSRGVLESKNRDDDEPIVLSQPPSNRIASHSRATINHDNFYDDSDGENGATDSDDEPSINTRRTPATATTAVAGETKSVASRRPRGRASTISSTSASVAWVQATPPSPTRRGRGRGGRPRLVRGASSNSHGRGQGRYQRPRKPPKE